MKARKPNNIGVWDDYTQYTALCRKLKIHESQWCAVYGVDDFYIHWNKLLKPKAMTQDTFDTLRTIVSETDHGAFNLEGEPSEQEQEFPNVRDRLKDGEDIIILYVELLDYLIYNMNWVLNEKSTEEQDEFAEDAEQEFWEQAKEVLVEPDGSQDEEGTHV